MDFSLPPESPKRAVFKNQSRISYVDGKVLTLDLIIQEPVLYNGFLKFAEKMLCPENFLFYKEVENFETISDEAYLER